MRSTHNIGFSISSSVGSVSGESHTRPAAATPRASATQFGVPLDGGHRRVQFPERGSVEVAVGQIADGVLHRVLHVLGEPRRGPELGRVGHLVEGDPAAEPIPLDAKFVGDSLDVRPDEVQGVTVPVREQERVVLAQDVVPEEREGERHRPGVDDSGDAGDKLRLLFYRCHHPLERGDVRVDPVVAVLYFDGLGKVEVDFAHGPDAVACVPDVRGVRRSFVVGDSEVTRVGRLFGGLGDGGPVDGTAARGTRDGADAVI